MIEMKGEEFAKKIMSGERDFAGIELEEGYNFNKYEGFLELQKYLRSVNLKKNPVNISGSAFNYVRATLYLPYIIAKNSDFYRAELGGANLSKADLSEACLMGAELSEAILRKTNLQGADLSRAYLVGANLQGADLSRATLHRSNLSRADIRDVKNLESALGLKYMVFDNLIVTGKEMKIIKAARKGICLFDENGIKSIG